MLYVLSITGNKAYVPYWFECNCSKADFKKAVKESISYVISNLVDNNYDGFIDGYILSKKAIIRLKKHYGFKYVKPDYEIMIGGECLYSKYGEKPAFMSNDDWSKILEHNHKVDEDLFKNERQN